ncbi:FG-GAP-like repeat-containing protein [Arthrobacter sp. AK01]|uniref:FG-GAP-like repeat-containing protein n=1 Tax=Arthrobacter sp. AK01 TaxID=2894084 RepID=UPI001E626FD8|nr:FG-GAP-like repeat-containing protein [Arthrobacter sp. AK01]MCD4853047.1 FG-GAP-like repeat-containing protein [Arthrobacter sp. AK01]
MGTVVSDSATPAFSFIGRVWSRRGTTVAAAGVAALLLAGIPAVPAEADVITDTLGVGPNGHDVAVNALTNTVYVATEDGLTIVNGATHAITKVNTGGTADAVAVNEATNKIYVGNRVTSPGGSVAVVDGTTLAVTMVPAGAQTEAIVVNQKTNKIYVGTRSGLYVINGTNNQTTQITTSPSSDLSINQATNKIYALSGGVMVIDGPTNTVSRLDAGHDVAAPVHLAINAATNQVYVALKVRNYMELNVIDGATHDVGGLFSSYDTSPTELTVDETRNKVYLGRSLGGGLGPATGIVSIFNGGSGGRVDIRTGLLPSEIAVNRTTNKLYVSTENGGTTVIDAASFAATTLNTGGAADVAINESTNKIYITEPPGSLNVIDGNSPTPLKNDFSGDRKTDLLARDGSGVLWLYPGNGTGGWLPRAQVGSAWNSMTAVVSPGDFNGDKKPDILARDGAGHLWMYPGNGAGNWLPRVHVGSGWGIISAIVTPGDFNGDGTADILARDTSGTLWLYPGNGRGDWLPRTNLGAGWNSLTAIVGSGDFNSDGTPDVLARDGSGVLWLYGGNGSGGWRWDRQQVGEGWNSMTAILAPGDFNGDGRPDIVARDSTGALFLYPGASGSGWLPTVRIGTGWNAMSAIL